MEDTGYYPGTCRVALSLSDRDGGVFFLITDFDLDFDRLLGLGCHHNHHNLEFNSKFYAVKAVH